MSFLFTCPHCQTQTMVEQRYSGQSGQCVTCGGPIELPHFAVGATETPAEMNSRARMVPWVMTALVVLLILGSLLVALLRFGGATVNRLTANRMQASSKANLQKIAEALNAYAADHGSYPPPAVMDKNNQPLLSWRVLLLPYLGEDDLYNQFDLTRGWDDAANMQAAYQMPAVYMHPASADSGMMESGYYVITGNGTLFPSTGPLGPDDVVDNPGQTILVTEALPTVMSGMWTEPVDLDYTRMRGQLGEESPLEIGGLLDGGVAFATIDGRSHFLPDTTSPAEIRALVTPRGGEPLADDTLD